MAGLYRYDNPKDAYAEAEVLIAKCRKAGGRQLNLSRMGLHTLPPSIGDLDVKFQDVVHVAEIWEGGVVKSTPTQNPPPHEHPQ